MHQYADWPDLGFIFKFDLVTDKPGKKKKIKIKECKFPSNINASDWWGATRKKNPKYYKRSGGPLNLRNSVFCKFRRNHF